MTGQIVFDLEKKDNFSVDDFIISETNNEVTSTLENMDQLLNKCAIVYGQKKSGKTHIAHIWQKRYEACTYEYKLKSLHINSMLLIVIVSIC